MKFPFLICMGRIEILETNNLVRTDKNGKQNIINELITGFSSFAQ